MNLFGFIAKKHFEVIKMIYTFTTLLNLWLKSSRRMVLHPAMQ